MKTKERLDLVLVNRGLYASRERAQAAIMAGLVLVDNQKIDKAGTRIDGDSSITITGDPLPYVSRGGLKLAHALQVFGTPIQGITAIDVGASTGGFTDCLLSQGAAKIFAVDVGYGQLAWSLRQDPRVVNIERTNIRHLVPAVLGEYPDLATIDVSFISLTKVLAVVAALLTEQGEIIALIKPQFEAGRALVGKRGVVRDPAVHSAVIKGICDWSMGNGLAVAGLTYSPISGPEGNREYFVYLQKMAGSILDLDTLIRETVDAAHTLVK